MQDPSRLRKEELARQARQHLDSLRSAGVEWLPYAHAPEMKLMVEPSLQADVVASEDRTLFPEAANTPNPAQAIQGSDQSFDERRKALDVLAETVSTCTRCPSLAATRTQTVFGVGQPGVELCFIGEAPGADEDRLGEPFVGAAGQLLDRIIAACGLKREEVYICNILKCRPPGNRTPQADEAANCSGFLAQQLELVRPKFICALGGTAAKYLLSTSQSMGQLRRRFHDYKGIPVLCTYHPAYLLPHRSPDKKRDVWEDMKMLLAKMGRPIPTKSS
jgi:DNA polymerase